MIHTQWYSWGKVHARRHGGFHGSKLCPDNVQEPPDLHLVVLDVSGRWRHRVPKVRISHMCSATFTISLGSKSMFYAVIRNMPYI